MLSFRLQMEFAPQNCDEATTTLRSLVGPVRSEPGCSATRLMMCSEEGCHLIWVEEWRGVEDFERHLRGATFRRLLAVIELAVAQPVVEVDDVVSRRGFDLVEEILGVSTAESVESGTV